jgi:fucose 4-O-acetylase-like acetyltransferase
MFGALASIVGSIITARAMGKLGGELGAYVDRWLRLMASIVISGLVNFLGIWGTVGLLALAKVSAPAALVAGFLSALAGTAFVIYRLWKDDPLTKGITIAVLSSIAKAAEDENITTTTRS